MADILICDDSVFMRLVLKKLLEENGHHIVGEASDGEEAVELYKTLRPELTTMDITMPKQDGLQAVKVIHNINPTAKVIMVTAIGQQPVILKALQTGAVDFIVKPFDSQQIISTINKVLVS
ncbi:MAG TPA: two-component system response regulator [Firmicutes bacterium]|nr:two-component system response regulator [Bacillota bacterium]